MTDAYRPAEDKDDTRYKIIEDILQAHAAAHAAEANCDPINRETRTRHCQQESADQQYEPGHQQAGTLAPVVHGRIVAGIAKEIGEKTLQEIGQPDDPQKEEQTTRREHKAANLPRAREEVGQQVIERIEQVQIGA